ncbi:MAG: N-acetyl-gamma-glutamyl-phosphate reductase [Dehalococcoidia bacterium]|nr:N-acetyl-gamma-glutamyl-phosphate reductase [Dehalococcoidia bacterium]
MAKIKVGILNVTGYAGSELARLLYRHPLVEIVSVTGRSATGQKLGEVFPHLADIDIKITSELDRKVDVAFSAMPHKASAEAILPLIRAGVRVIDISADFRLKDSGLYPKWYQFDHPAPDLLAEAVYGLTELYRRQIRRARLVANPGCYPTSAILALAPAFKAGLIRPEVVLDSKSGISGAGRTLSLNTHFAEASDSVSAYGLEGHRHLPEIVQELTLLNRRRPVSVTFIPHLVPMTRGILTTCYAPFRPGKLSDVGGPDGLKELYKEFYRNEPFVRVVDSPPGTKHTWGNNYCLLYPSVYAESNRLIVVSVLDNLVKGAAGQAIENMNVMFGLDEVAGLEALAVYP